MVPPDNEMAHGSSSLLIDLNLNVGRVPAGMKFGAYLALQSIDAARLQKSGWDKRSHALPDGRTLDRPEQAINLALHRHGQAS